MTTLPMLYSGLRRRSRKDLQVKLIMLMGLPAKRGRTNSRINPLGYATSSLVLQIVVRLARSLNIKTGHAREDWLLGTYSTRGKIREGAHTAAN